jgi:hypothetical protein
MRPPNHYNGDQFWRVTKLELENYVFGMLLGTLQGTRNNDLLVFSIYALISAWKGSPFFFFYFPFCIMNKGCFCIFFPNCQMMSKYKFYAFAISKYI